MSSIPDQDRDNNTAAASESNAPRDAANNQTAEPQPQLFAIIDGERQAVPFSDITDEPRRLQFKQRCQQATAPVVLNVIEFFVWPDAVRFLLLKFVKELGDRVRLQIGDDQAQYPNAFEAVLAVLPTAVSPEQQTGAKQAAIVAAALFLAQNAWPAAANTIADSLTEIGMENLAALEMFNIIRNVAGITIDPKKPDPDDLASHFHGCLQLETRTPSGEPALRYFRDDFYIWNGQTWQRVDDKEFKARITRHLQNAFAIGITDTLVNNVILNLKGQTLLNAGQLQIPFWIDSESPLSTHSLPLVVFRNGIVDIDDGEPYEDGWSPPRLYEHDPRCFSTVILPYEYDPLAECPLWERTLDEIFPRETGDNRIRVLQEFMGLTLFPNQMRHEKFLITVGHGANGKSTILRVWERMLGSNNVSHVPLDALGSEFRLYDMMGKLANIASDMKRMDKMEEGRLKELVSGEPLQVNRKFKSPLTMVPTARLIFATNELPPINDKSDGIWRRMIAMPFNVQFKEAERDLDRAERLRAELPGIFNWALAGAIRLFEQGSFTRCVVCDRCAGEHRQHSDSFLEFMDEMTELGSGKRVLVDDFYQAYTEYCGRSGRHAKAKAEIGKQVPRLSGVTRTRQTAGARKYEYQGIGLLSGALRGQFTPIVGFQRQSFVPRPSAN
ncbi:MAG: phage/plasmid primase, P4 family [Planctomycetota bacterium]